MKTTLGMITGWIHSIIRGWRAEISRNLMQQVKA